jgi:putative Holliday junction resolvase
LARILALDYGQKRTGLAVTDELQISINPLPTLLTVDLFDFVIKYLKNNNVENIVIGYPTHADGTPTKLTEHIEKLSSRLKSVISGIDIQYVDEAYTSREARNNLIKMGVKKKARMKKENIDRGSAVLILKSFLDTKYSL